MLVVVTGPALRELQHFHRAIDVRRDAERAHEKNARGDVIIGRERTWRRAKYPVMLRADEEDTSL